MRCVGKTELIPTLKFISTSAQCMLHEKEIYIIRKKFRNVQICIKLLTAVHIVEKVYFLCS